MNYNSDFKYDLKVGKVKEIELGEIFNAKTIEVKYDLKALETKNIFVEYFSRGYPSGISKTKADKLSLWEFTKRRISDFNVFE